MPYRQQGQMSPLVKQALGMAFDYAKGQQAAQVQQQQAAAQQQHRMEDAKFSMFNSLLGSMPAEEAVMAAPGLTQQLLSPQQPPSASEQWGAWMGQLAEMEVPDAFEEDRQAALAQAKRLETESVRLPPEYREQVMGRMMADPTVQRVMQSGREKPTLQQQFEQETIAGPNGERYQVEYRSGARKFAMMDPAPGSWAKVGQDAIKRVDEWLAQPVDAFSDDEAMGATRGDADPGLRWRMYADQHVATMFGASDEEVAQVREWYRKRQAEVMEEAQIRTSGRQTTLPPGYLDDPNEGAAMPPSPQERRHVAAFQKGAEDIQGLQKNLSKTQREIRELEKARAEVDTLATVQGDAMQGRRGRRVVDRSVVDQMEADMRHAQADMQELQQQMEAANERQKAAYEALPDSVKERMEAAAAEKEAEDNAVRETAFDLYKGNEQRRALNMATDRSLQRLLKGMPIIRDEEQLEMLPDGAQFLGPDGKIRRKGERAAAL